MFYDRSGAGRLLATALEERFTGSKDLVVVAIPRGGVIVGVEVARKLGCPLDTVLVRKIGHPGNPEFAVCVVSESRLKCEDEGETLDKEWLKGRIEEERTEIRRRKAVYNQGGREPVIWENKTIILVDDGVATGLSYLMAVEEVRTRGPKKVIAALPVMPAEFRSDLEAVVDEVVCLKADESYLGAVGAYYESFPQVTDEEVVKELVSL